MNRFKIWQNFLISTVLVVGIIFSLPNFFPTNPALQVASSNSSIFFDTSIKEEIEKLLKKNNVFVDKIENVDNALQITLQSVNDQLTARRLIADYSKGEFIIALNSVATTPNWLKDLGGKPLNLGLDLAGGVHFLLEVDTERYSTERLSSEGASLLEEFSKRGINSNYKSSSDEITLNFTSANDVTEAKDYLDQNNFSVSGSKYDLIQNGNSINLRYTSNYLAEIVDYAVDQNLVALRNRVNELGVSEPIVQRQGGNRIVVLLPGVQDPTAAKKIIGKTANLEFRMEANARTSPLRKEEFSFKENEFQTAFLERSVVVSGDRVTNANTGFDESGFAQVNITLDMEGGRAMQKATSGNIGRRLGVLFVEQKTKSELVTNEIGESVIEQTSYIEKNIISLATVQAVLGTSFRITGVGSPAEASELALLLRAGALAAPMKFVEERTVGPSLGKENIELGMKSIVIGFALVVLFMIFYYRVFGIAANISLILNLVLITGIMSLLGASLTLPGMAGIVLTVGMAVDANVLIFSRIREELKEKDPQSAIRDGFSRAFVTIFDANVTTLITALILYIIGTGPVKGFAITLSIGIVTSMFTAIMCTRAMVNLVYGNKNIQELKI